MADTTHSTDTRSGPGRERPRGAEHADDQLPNRPTAQQGPPTPTDLSGPSWWGVLKRTASQVSEDNLTDWAAALTYYGVQSLFPGLLVLIAGLRLFGAGTTQRILTSVTGLAPGPTRSVLQAATTNLQHAQSGTAGVLAIVGVAGALWSASGYIGAFMRAANAIYDVPEGRPLWMKLPIRLAITIVTGVLLAATALAVVLTGGLASQVGKLLHLGNATVVVWDIAKWPVIVVVISLLFAILYWAAPNARHGGFRWVSPGSVLAVVIWLLASAGFALYVANFGHYNKTYGSLAAVIIFLVWLWISNLALLLGAEFDAELQRGRAIAAGHAPDDEPYLELRSARTLDRHKDDDLR